MRCEDFERWVNDWLDAGAFPSLAESNWARHVEQCDRCRQAYARYRVLWRALREVRPQEPPALWLEATVQASVAQAADQTARVHQGRTQTYRRLVVAAACVGVVVSALALVARSRPPEPTQRSLVRTPFPGPAEPGVTARQKPPRPTVDAVAEEVPWPGLDWVLKVEAMSDAVFTTLPTAASSIVEPLRPLTTAAVEELRKLLPFATEDSPGRVPTDWKSHPKNHAKETPPLPRS
jgi:hypothetical protein